MIDNAPIMAAIVKAISPMNPNRLKAIPPILPDNKTTKATPKLAPELIPNTEGPANGLRNTVCICKPLTANPAPATMAVNACGTRDFQMIFCQMTDSPSSIPQRIFQMERKGISTEPKNRFSRNSTPMDNANNSMYKVTGFFISTIHNKQVDNLPVTIVDEKL